MQNRQNLTDKCINLKIFLVSQKYYIETELDDMNKEKHERSDKLKIIIKTLKTKCFPIIKEYKSKLSDELAISLWTNNKINIEIEKDEKIINYQNNLIENFESLEYSHCETNFTEKFIKSILDSQTYENNENITLFVKFAIAFEAFKTRIMTMSKPYSLEKLSYVLNDFSDFYINSFEPDTVKFASMFNEEKAKIKKDPNLLKSYKIKIGEYQSLFSSIKNNSNKNIEKLTNVYHSGKTSNLQNSIDEAYDHLYALLDYTFHVSKTTEIGTFTSKS